MTPTEPGTPQTAAAREQLARVPEYMKPEVSRQLCAIEAEARSARDAEIRAAIKAMKWHDRWTDDGDEYVLERYVLAILDADTPS